MHDAVAMSERESGADFQRTLPHERWLARRFGVVDAQQPDAAPLAAYMLLADGGMYSPSSSSGPPSSEGCNLDGTKITVTNIEPAGSVPALVTCQVQAVAGYAKGHVPGIEIRASADLLVRRL